MPARVFVVTLKINSPSAGFPVAFCCTVVNLGTKTTLVVLYTSGIAELSGKLPSVLIAFRRANAPATHAIIKGLLKKN
ncbi:MAG: hypothetical protein AB9834_12835 [Lentimicrobium sp.]